MSRIVVLGAGVIGLSTAIMLAQRGHDVSVLERDSEPVPASPDESWSAWARRGVVQFRQPHFLHAAGRHILDDRLPEVKEALLDSGCVSFAYMQTMPPSITDRSAREGDERFLTVTGRRTTIEYAIARMAKNLVDVQRGVTIANLMVSPRSAGVPHVTGVRMTDDREVTADLIIDATGRASKLPSWLEAIGARRPIEEVEESGFIYYTRFFHSPTGEVPRCRAALLTHFHTFSLLTLPGDSKTWSATVFIYSGDPALKEVRHLKHWTRLFTACPMHAHWLDGDPISDVLSMGGVTDRYRRFVLDGAPVATGIIAVGDAWACTNPVNGRGITMGLMHAAGTVDLVDQHLKDPLALALAHDAMTEARVTPWYRHTVEFDRKRTSQIKANIEGQPLPRPSEAGDALPMASVHDPDLFRAFIEINSMLALPSEVLARPGLVERIMHVASTHDAIVPPSPSRNELLRMLAS